MTSKQELIFWQKAMQTIKNQYGAKPCKETHIDCAQCQAHIAIGWIRCHIDLLEWDIEDKKKKL